MKKNKTNNNTSNTTKKMSARQLKKQNKEQHVKEKQQRAKERIAVKEARKQQNERKAVTVNAKPIKKALKSMGGVSITTLTKEQRENLVIKRNLLRKEREKLYEELLMDEEGMTDTPNKLIHIGHPIDVDEVKLAHALRVLESAAQNETDDMRLIVESIVPTYHPKLNKSTQ